MGFEQDRNVMKLIYIKDLLIFQPPTIYQMIEKYIEDAKQKDVFIGYLAMNQYIYESRSLDISFLINYIKSLDKITGVFRDIYDEYIYELRLKGLLDSVNKTDFHMIFNAVNNKFNLYLTDQYLFQDFGIYRSQTSLETIMDMYETFNDYFIYSLLGKISPNELKILIYKKNFKYLPYIYDKIFEQFEDIYLPFY